MLLAHALAYARADLVAGDSGGEKFPTGQVVALGDRDQRGQGDCAHVQRTFAVDVVELEALHRGAVGERGMRGGEAQPRAPDRGRARLVERCERRLQDATPLELRAIDGATEGIEDEKLDAPARLAGNPLIAQRRDEFGDPAGVQIVHAGMLGHVDHL